MNEEPLPDEPDVLTIGGRQFVYLDEEEIEAQANGGTTPTAGGSK